MPRGHRPRDHVCLGCKKRFTKQGLSQHLNGPSNVLCRDASALATGMVVEKLAAGEDGYLANAAANELLDAMELQEF